MSLSPHDISMLPKRYWWDDCGSNDAGSYVDTSDICLVDGMHLTPRSTLFRMMVEAGCLSFDDLPAVTSLEYSIDHADVYLSEVAAERLLLPLCGRDADADEIKSFAAGVAAVSCKGFSAAAAAAIMKFAQMGVAVVPVPSEGGNDDVGMVGAEFNEDNVTWDCVSWEDIKSDGLLTIMCHKLQSEGLYLAHHHYQQQQQQQQQTQPNQLSHPIMFPSLLPSHDSTSNDNVRSRDRIPPEVVAYKICVAGRTVALASPFSFVLPSAPSALLPTPPPSPVVAYLAASCARSRDLPQLLALLTCNIDVFGSMPALSMIEDSVNDASAASDLDDDDKNSQEDDRILSVDDKRWLFCAASAWALDFGQQSDDSSSNYIIAACLQSADILNDICCVPLLPIQVRPECTDYFVISHRTYLVQIYFAAPFFTSLLTSICSHSLTFCPRLSFCLAIPPTLVTAKFGDFCR